MWSENLRAAGGAAVALAAILAVAAAAHAAQPPAADGLALGDQFPLTATGQSGGVDSPQADEPPAVVPLPPALGTGLAGLAGMVVFRVGRRVYRRR